SIAVIGAGLSGLTHALYLARGLLNNDEKHRIVVYDSADRVGGWVKSDRIKPVGMEDDEGALLEAGPRSIRMADLGGLSTTELIATLDLGGEVITVPKTAESAYRRMIKYDGHFHVLPHDQWSLFQTSFKPSHIFQKADFGDILNALNIGERKPIRSRFPDETVEGFFTRLLAPKNKDGSLKDENSPTPAIVEYLASAMFHGIYAADVSQLSMRAVLPQVYHPALTLFQDKKSWLPWPFNIRLTPYYLLGRQGEEWAKVENFKQGERLMLRKYMIDRLGEQITKMVAESSVLSFKNGLQTLTDAIANECRQRGVEFRLNSKIDSIHVQEQNGKAVIRSEGGKKEVFNKVTSSLPSKALQGLLKDTKLPHLAANPSTTVCVVNFAIPAKYKIRLPPAFGYLIPRASAKEGDNPFGHLGTVFDSEAVPGQDSYTKLTMMFGGPYWKPALAIEIASIVLEPHLQDSGQDRSIIDNPDIIKRISVQKDCIPTYTVGHMERMYELHQALKKTENAPLSVLGASYTGVSLNDCILHARRTAMITINS
ncbi:Protoporphyrinogen oxidase, partial [Meira miltonrushii]